VPRWTLTVVSPRAQLAEAERAYRAARAEAIRAALLLSEGMLEGAAAELGVSSASLKRGLVEDEGGTLRSWLATSFPARRGARLSAAGDLRVSPRRKA